MTRMDNYRVMTTRSKHKEKVATIYSMLQESNWVKKKKVDYHYVNATYWTILMPYKYSPRIVCFEHGLNLKRETRKEKFEL